MMLAKMICWPMSITILGEPLGDDMMSHGSSISCLYSIVLAGDMVAIKDAHLVTPSLIDVIVCPD